MAAPLEQAELLKNSTAQFGLRLSQATLYFSCALFLIYSTSLRAFFNQQLESGTSPLVDLRAVIRRLFSKGAEQPQEDSFMTRWENRPRYPVLTREILRSLDDYDLADAVFDYVSLKIEGSKDSDFTVVSQMPLGFQAVYSTWWVHAEVNNGGFHQYFYNQGINWAFMALEGYKLFGSTELASLMARAIEIYLEEEQEQLNYQTPDLSRMIEQYVEARRASALPDLDDMFYRLESGDRAAEYIRNHLDEFIAR